MKMMNMHLQVQSEVAQVESYAHRCSLAYSANFCIPPLVSCSSSVSELQPAIAHRMLIAAAKRRGMVPDFSFAHSNFWIQSRGKNLCKPHFAGNLWYFNKEKAPFRNFSKFLRPQKIVNFVY